MTLQEMIEKLESIKDDPHACIMAERILARGVEAVVCAAEERARRQPRKADTTEPVTVPQVIPQASPVCIHRGKLLVDGSCGCSRAYECNHESAMINGQPGKAFGRSCGAGKCKVYEAKEAE